MNRFCLAMAMVFINDSCVFVARIPNELWLTSTFYYLYTCRALHLCFDLLYRVMIRPKTLVTNEMAISTDTARVCG